MGITCPCNLWCHRLFHQEVTRSASTKKTFSKFFEGFLVPHQIHHTPLFLLFTTSSLIKFLSSLFQGDLTPAIALALAHSRTHTRTRSHPQPQLHWHTHSLTLAHSLFTIPHTHTHSHTHAPKRTHTHFLSRFFSSPPLSHSTSQSLFFNLFLSRLLFLTQCVTWSL